MPDPDVSTEGKFQRWIQRTAKSLGWVCDHTYRAQLQDGSWRTTSTLDGKPDLMLLQPRSPIVFLEVKGPTGQASPRQLEIVRTMQTIPSVVAFIVWPRDWELVRDVLVDPWDFANHT